MRTYTVIQLPLYPASLTDKNPQRHNAMNYSWHAYRRMQRMFTRFEDFLVECPVFVISSAVV